VWGFDLAKSMLLRKEGIWMSETRTAESFRSDVNLQQPQVNTMNPPTKIAYWYIAYCRDGPSGLDRSHGTTPASKAGQRFAWLKARHSDRLTGNSRFPHRSWYSKRFSRCDCSSRSAY
jgi:hypothetical protein